MLHMFSNPFNVRASRLSGSYMFSHNSPTDRAREIIKPLKVRKVFVSIQIRQFWF